MSQQSGRRGLTEQEIDALIQNGCTAADWCRIEVTEPFSPDRLIDAHFSGDVSFGLLSGVVRLGDTETACGVYHAGLHNCRVGYNSLIRNVSDRLSNLVIEDHVVINDVKAITAEGTSTFGNGTGAAVVNENGGRAFSIYEGLSAQTAYILSMYRHRPGLLNKLQALIFERIRHSESDRAVIEAGASIQHCGVLQNVAVGAAAVLEGVSRLENATVASYPEDPTKIGVDVIARDVIIAEGAAVTDAVRLRRCYVGQGVRLGSGFSAVDSLFFANSHFEQGEACSIFAGPFSVSHHKATLLIAGLFSFYNAGSGTNQSNHMYKLGPVHQGLLERGCKTGSDSYLLWPARIGAFSTVIGKHSKRIDLSRLPFSVLLERHGKPQLFAALNLTNMGLVRDANKWPVREHRKASALLDYVNPAVLSPYTAQKMLDGIDLLETLQQKHPDSEQVLYAGVRIASPGRAAELYRLALDRYYGQVLTDRLELLRRAEGAHLAAECATDQFSTLKQYLGRKVDLGLSRWADAAGLLTPIDALDLLLDDIEQGRLDSLDEIQVRLAALHENYAEYEWAWVLNQLEAGLGKPLADWSRGDFKQLLETGREAADRLHAMVLEDAGKEFAPASRIGYGIDDPESVAADFEAVCGAIQTHPAIKTLNDMAADRKGRLADLIETLLG